MVIDGEAEIYSIKINKVKGAQLNEYNDNWRKWFAWQIFGRYFKR